MKILKQTDDIYLLDTPGAPRFKRFEAAFGWMDPNAKEERKSCHALMVGGEKEDGNFSIFEEFLGNLPQTVAAATDAKDRLWLPRIWFDGSRRDILLQVAHEDWAEGLTRYREAGKDPFNRTVHVEKHPEKRWENFRSWDAKASLTPVPEFLAVDPSAAFNRILGLAANNQLKVHTSCSELRWCLDHKVPGDILDHPVVVATIYLVWALEQYRTKLKPELKSKETASVWGNLPRGRL